MLCVTTRGQQCVEKGGSGKHIKYIYLSTNFGVLVLYLNFFFFSCHFLLLLHPLREILHILLYYIYLIVYFKLCTSYISYVLTYKTQ